MQLAGTCAYEVATHNKKQLTCEPSSGLRRRAMVRLGVQKKHPFDSLMIPGHADIGPEQASSAPVARRSRESLDSLTRLTRLNHSTHSLESLTRLTRSTHSLDSLTRCTSSTHSLTRLTHSTHSLDALTRLTHPLPLPFLNNLITISNNNSSGIVPLKKLVWLVWLVWFVWLV